MTTSRSAAFLRHQLLAAAALVASIALTGCGSLSKSSGKSYTAGAAEQLSQNINYLKVSSSDTNAMSVDVGVCGGTLNIPCATVTICQPGWTNASTQCQTINNILLDTGSYGLRVFSSLVTNFTFTPEKSGGNDVAECASYLDGSADWGQVASADVYLGSNTGAMEAANVPIELINAGWPSTSVATNTCADEGNSAIGYPYTLDATPASTGFNGVLGVGLFNQDCGSTCSGSSNNSMYFTCSGSSCSGYAAPSGSQVSNPIASLDYLNGGTVTGYNNGVALELPGVPTGGAVSAPGYLIFGINSSGNGSGSIADNTPGSSVMVYTTDSNGYMDTYFNGSIMSSFVDSGSNGLYFPGPSSLTVCSSLSPFFCPNSLTSYTATDYPYTTGNYTGGTDTGGTDDNSSGTCTGGTYSGGAYSGGTCTGGSYSAGTDTGGTYSGSIPCALGYADGTDSGGTYYNSGGTCTGGTYAAGAYTGGTCTGGSYAGGTDSAGYCVGANETFSIDNASDEFDSSNPNIVFNNLGGDLPGQFDWGLPFFLGRTIFIGINGTSATINGTNYTGPYFAF